MTKSTTDTVLKRPGALLWRASKLWQSNMHMVLTDLGLSSTNAIVLSNILRFELDGKKTTQAQLASFCSIDRMTMSTLLRSLIAKEFVERKVCQEDRRLFELSLTDKGREAAHEALQRIDNVHRDFFGVLDDRGLENLTNGLSELLKMRHEAALVKRKK